MIENLTLPVAFIAGTVSFLSPCVLPIIPGFLAYLAGANTTDATPRRWDLFLASLFFVLGFSAVFTAIGVLLNVLIGHAAFETQMWLARIGGAIVVLFGLYLTGLFRIPFFERAHQFRVTRKFRSRSLGAFLFGAAFAAGWTPCVGVVLGGILGLAAAAPGSATLLLVGYSLGFGVPFLIVGLFASHATTFINRHIHVFKYVNIVFGIILVILGVLAFTRSLYLVAGLDVLSGLFLGL